MGVPRLPAFLLLLGVGPRTWAPEKHNHSPQLPCLRRRCPRPPKPGPLRVGTLGVGGLEKGAWEARGEVPLRGVVAPTPTAVLPGGGIRPGCQVTGLQAERLSGASQPSHLGWAQCPWRPDGEGCFSRGPAPCLAGLDCSVGCSAHHIVKGDCLTGTPPHPTSPHPHQGQETSLK